MSYQVLARKWRPSTFKEMVGQVHVLRALMNALDQQRLHHAYLFTGTRGVGKTTIARLVAKSLNCEVGVSSTPCGTCSACTEIAEGRFVDLIEVDAASRTKVEDTRELLENVQYAPTRGRYKVYLIDEVHMLSTSSFNALLKTLEEPPEHVKFLLATTDPQKLPVTVLSRCLQFNLKNMSREHIVQHLSHILSEEKVGFDDASLWAIAESAQGSMRDALSLTDQAIAFGEGQLRENEVASMLGTVDLKRVLKLAQLLFEKNIDGLMALIQEVDDHAPDYQALMAELMSTLHRLAIAQAAPSAIDNQKGDQDAILHIAKNTSPEDVHLYYQIAIKAKPEMALAPSERAGFEMALLRMLAFSQTPAVAIGELPTLVAAEAKGTAAQVQEAGQDQIPKLERSQEPSVEPENTQSLQQLSSAESSDSPYDVTEQVSDSNRPGTAEQIGTKTREVATENGTPPWEATVEDAPNQTRVNEIAPVPVPESHEPEPKAEQARLDAVGELEISQSLVKEGEQPADALPESSDTPQSPLPAQTSAEELLLPTQSQPATWPETDKESDPVFWWQVSLHRMGLTGMTKTVFANSQWKSFDDGTLNIQISPNYKKIMNDSHCERLLQSVKQWLPECKHINYEFGAVESTPQRWADDIVHRAKHAAKTELLQDSFIQQLMSDYQAELDEMSINPNLSPIPTGA
ncbi:DNA polymerase III subunit gamma/tau [Reinekea marina]|uniref:DNA polymerase III subunit gamma/tau n=1 Tax=Reinekea marina TaxID=1310421 RepID=A0ABV7WY14_9GAMM|nr:DNA polymerase III subunit gamma/tau [Reinekea marina]MDN3649796.1 DNA polymerase III subunit gamma/tau [Reinekea marina]